MSSSNPLRSSSLMSVRLSHRSPYRQTHICALYSQTRTLSFGAAGPLRHPLSGVQPEERRPHDAVSESPGAYLSRFAIISMRACGESRSIQSSSFVPGRGLSGLSAAAPSLKASPSIAPSPGPTITVSCHPFSVVKVFSHPSPLFFHVLTVLSTRKGRVVDAPRPLFRCPLCRNRNSQAHFRSAIVPSRISHHLPLLLNRPAPYMPPRYRAELHRYTGADRSSQKLRLRTRTPAR